MCGIVGVVSAAAGRRGARRADARPARAPRPRRRRAVVRPATDGSCSVTGACRSSTEPGGQPAVPVAGRRRSSLILNGEIYNFRALRAELEEAGAIFRTSSDTEVLLAAYRAWGADCVDRLSGMFAFAIWDAERSVLFCARDRAGEKPFYYVVDGATFASPRS